MSRSGERATVASRHSPVERLLAPGVATTARGCNSIVSNSNIEVICME